MTYWQILLAACGVVLTLTQGSLFSFLHKRAEYFRCALCVAWAAVGLIAYLAWSTDSIEWRAAATLPPATAFLSHLAANFVAACYRVSAEPAPEQPPETHPGILESPAELES